MTAHLARALPAIACLALLAACLGGQRRGQGEGVAVGQREVAEDQAHPAVRLVDDPAQHRRRGRAVRALVVPVLDEGDRSRNRTLHVVPLTDRSCEVGGSGHHAAFSWAEIDSSARRMPSAPGLTPIGET